MIDQDLLRDGIVACENLARAVRALEGQLALDEGLVHESTVPVHVSYERNDRSEVHLCRVGSLGWLYGAEVRSKQPDAHLAVTCPECLECLTKPECIVSNDNTPCVPSYCGLCYDCPRFRGP